MKLLIRPGMQIGEVQKAFNDAYPFLRLEFYRHAADVKQGRRMKDDHLIGEVQDYPVDSEIEVLPKMSVRELESRLKNEFALTVQVFRQSGRMWLQTTFTDDWTLEHQNHHGKEITQEKKRKADDGLDYDLDRDAV